MTTTMQQQTTMTAVVQDEYGSDPAEVFTVAPVPVPTPGKGEVVVRVKAAAVDRGTWHVMTGYPLLGRLAFGLRAPKVRVPGRDVAGTVEAVGPDVTGFVPGDEVFGSAGATASGSFAELALARADRLAPKPANLSFEQAAAVPISGLTALQAVRDHARARPGEKLLIIGASGGVGTFAVQIAKAFGADVTGVCSTAKLDAVRALGADRVIDYSSEDFASGEHRYDVILDTGGNRRLADLRRALTPAGRPSSSEARPTDAGSEAPTASSARRRCRPSSPRRSGRSSHQRTPPTWSPSRGSSRPARSRPPSSGPTPSPTSPQRSAT